MAARPEPIAKVIEIVVSTLMPISWASTHRLADLCLVDEQSQHDHDGQADENRKQSQIGDRQTAAKQIQGTLREHRREDLGI